MNKKIFFIIIAIIVVAAVGFFLLKPTPIKAPQIPPPFSGLSGDAYPLYSGADWSEPVAQTITLGTSTVQGMEVSATPATGTMAPSDVFIPFEDYYASKLTAAGWVVDNSLAANGPGSGMTVFRKGDAVIVLNYRSVFSIVSGTAPARCPCDVSISIFSSL